MSANQNTGQQEDKADQDEFLRTIDEASRNARKIYLLYLGLLAYCALTVVSTTDRQIILNEAAKLPIINLELPLDGFFVITPILIIFVFIYFQLYLLRLRKLIFDFRARYKTVKEDLIYPWLVNFVDESSSESPSRFQKIFVQISLWWAMPFVHVLIATWYLKKHEPYLTLLVGVIIPAIGTALIWQFWQKFESYQVVPSESKLIKHTLSRIYITCFVAVFMIFYLIEFRPNALKGNVLWPRWHWPCIDLSNQKLITEQDERYSTLYWVDLEGAHLQGANLTGSILEHANLKKARLKNAVLFGARLQKARLDSTHLINTVLSQAELQQARLNYVNAKKALFEMARLDSAQIMNSFFEDTCKFYSSTLKYADLSNSQFRNAVLSRTNLKGAILIKTDLTRAALTWSVLDSANLSDAVLHGTDLKYCSLKDADLSRAILDSADLRYSTNLTLNQLSKARTLRGTKLSATLLDSIRQLYPHLLAEAEAK